ncbi:MAG: hypothetical protein Q8P18_19195 [Pseudomonadota bacterium]|nr:hypothetical protein [Pseudomonadota bacterium]
MTLSKGLLAKGLLLAVALVAPLSASALDPAVEAKIMEAENLLFSANPADATYALTAAKDLAIQKLDVDGLLWLAEDYLILGDDRMVKETYSLATQYAFDLANYDPNHGGSGTDCLGGIMGLEMALLQYDFSFAGLPDGPLKTELTYMRDHAQTNLDALYANGCTERPAGASLMIDGVPGENGLAIGNTVRPFGDTAAADQWASFSFPISGAPATITQAKVTFRVKPLGGLTDTDSLILQGASGAHYDVYHDFAALPQGEYSEVEVDVSGNADILAAIQSGTLLGVIQDDTAVEWVRLELSGGELPV